MATLVIQQRYNLTKIKKDTDYILGKLVEARNNLDLEGILI